MSGSIETINSATSPYLSNSICTSILLPQTMRPQNQVIYERELARSLYTYESYALLRGLSAVGGINGAEDFVADYPEQVLTFQMSNDFKADLTQTMHLSGPWRYRRGEGRPRTIQQILAYTRG